MIKLHGFGANNGLPDASPFVLKIDAFLRLAGLPFKPKTGMDNMKNAPKGKLPFISDGEDVVADSRFIIQHLQAKHGVDLDAHLSDEQKAIAYTLQTTLEEQLYWCVLHFRWVDDAGWAQVKAAFFDKMPMPLKVIVPLVVRRQMRDAIKKQGTGLHSDDEILSIARECLQHVSNLIGDGPYLFGDKPCSVDAAVYGFVAQVTLATIDTPVNQAAKEHPALQRYCEHFRDTHYAES